MGRLETWLTLILIFLMSLCILSGLSVPVGDEIRDYSSEVGQRKPSRPWPWRVATKASDNHHRRTLREASRRRHLHRDLQHHPPDGYYVSGEFPAPRGQRSQWRLTSGYSVRYKCPMKSYWLPEALEQHSFNCDAVFVDKK